MEVFYYRFEPRAIRYAIAFLGNEDAAHSAVQDAFIKVYKYASSFRGKSSVQVWFFRVLSNCCRDSLKKRPHISLGENAALLTTPESEEGKDREDKERVRIAIDELSPDQRRLIFLYYYEDLSYVEIADILEMPMGTVGPTLTRLHDKLRSILEKSK